MLHQGRRPNNLNDILNKIVDQSSRLTSVDGVGFSKIIEDLDLLLFREDTTASDVVVIVRAVRQILESWEKREERWVLVQDLARAVSVRHSFWIASKYYRSDLVSLAKDHLSDPNPYVRRGVVHILCRLGVSEAGGLIIPLMNDTNHFVREVAVKAMSVLSVPGARPLLIASLSDRNPFVRRAALRTLVIRGELNLLQANEALKRLPLTEIQGGLKSAVSILVKDKMVSAGLSREDYVAKVQQAFRLVVLYSVQEAIPTLHYGVRGRDVPLSYAAAQTALSVGGGEAVPSIIELLHGRKNASAIEQFHSDSFLIEVIHRLNHRLAAVQSAARQVLLGLGEDLVLRRLKKLSNHWNREIKRQAVIALNRLEECLGRKGKESCRMR